MIQVDYHKKYLLAWLGIGVAICCLIGYQSLKGHNVKPLLIKHTSRSLATASGCVPGTVDEVWSPCYSDTWEMNRDARGAQWCRDQGFDGVDPNGWTYCYTSWFTPYYKFKCAITHSRDWSPCYRNEDATAMGYKDRDAAGLAWCININYNSVGAWNSCDNSYYKFQCEHWSPCYISDLVGMNRDAKGAQWCRTQGFDGVDPWGYKGCFFIGYYRFKCANTHSLDWSPCYRDEDAYAMGYKNRDEAGLNWCKKQGFNSVDNWKYCGNWYYQFHCTTSQVLPDFVTIDALTCETSSDFATIEYLLRYGAYSNANSLCTSPLCKRDKDDITDVGNYLISFQRAVAQWDLDMAERATSGGTLVTWTDPVTRINWRIDRQTANINRIVPIMPRSTVSVTISYHLFAVQAGSNTYASIMVPVGYNVGARRIRNAFLQSQQNLQTATLQVDNNMPTQNSWSFIAREAIRFLTWSLLINNRRNGSGSSGSLSTMVNIIENHNGNNQNDSNLFTIFLATDAYGSTETAWNLTRLYKNDTTEIANKNVGTYLNNNTYSEKYVLDIGVYNFTIFDSGWNGICCNFGNGTYTIRLGNLLLKTGGNFSAYESTIFEVQHIQTTKNITTTLVPTQNSNVAPTPKKPPVTLKKRSRPPKLSQ